jgi:transglutaminase-like putative cysteine protease
MDESAPQLMPDELPNRALPFLLPSRYCESDLLGDRAWNLFGDLAPGWDRVQAIVDWVHDQIDFDYGRSSTSHTAVSMLQDSVGVCRDYTHVAIALCRALNIPARYAFGYLPDIDVPDPGTPMDFCAWMEVQLGGRWYTFDVRNNQRRKGRVLIGRGRDAADVAMVTSFGSAPLLDMRVTAEQVGNAASVHADATFQ